MTNIKIVTDSAASLSPSTIKDLDITIIDLPIFINGNLYGSVNNIPSDKFLHLLGHCTTTPTIGPANVKDLTNLYDELGRDGSQIISIHLSSSLTSTFKTAQVAAKASKSYVSVLDSRATSSGLAYQVTKFADYIKLHYPIDKIINLLNNLRQRTRTYFSVANNNQLINQQLISKFRGKIEQRFKTSYIYQFTNNNFDLMMRSRSVDKFWDNQIQKMHNENIVKLSVLHAGNSQWASVIQDVLATEFPFINIEIHVTKPEMACFMGLGATGITYLLG
ncbi:DegV family protein [Lentilactobacillus sp. SPB1-3]|uniref:DegV family protein n=1 Tax=Lentilactobacillus terminaliae TaxID=3003483 RepID=A0ACD5DE61_9LACO|nr:DegV family protein [Lentilactobacillus sp. SPB1-3]MCZ0977565.1 DegV family EDD domain-containing protein [Lentilactobacillus sp. SPB1-3]